MPFPPAKFCGPDALARQSTSDTCETLKPWTPPLLWRKQHFAVVVSPGKPLWDDTFGD
jgi:hypothetical protein